MCSCRLCNQVEERKKELVALKSAASILQALIDNYEDYGETQIDHMKQVVANLLGCKQEKSHNTGYEWAKFLAETARERHKNSKTKEER